MTLQNTQPPPPPVPVVEDEDDVEVAVEPGTKCLRAGCKHSFVSQEESRGEGAQSKCIYHPKPVSAIFCSIQDSERPSLTCCSPSFMKEAK